MLSVCRKQPGAVQQQTNAQQSEEQLLECGYNLLQTTITAPSSSIRKRKQVYALYLLMQSWRQWLMPTHTDV